MARAIVAAVWMGVWSVIGAGCGGGGAAADHEVADALQGRPTARVTSASTALQAQLTASELQTIVAIDWGTAAPAQLISDATYLKALRAVLPYAQVTSTAASQGLRTEALPAVCMPGCEKCRAAIQNAINFILAEIDQIKAARACTNPICAAAILVKHADLLAQVAALNYCLLHTYTGSSAGLGPLDLQLDDVDNVIAMITSCFDPAQHTCCTNGAGDAIIDYVGQLGDSIGGAAHAYVCCHVFQPADSCGTLAGQPGTKRTIVDLCNGRTVEICVAPFANAGYSGLACGAGNGN